MNTLLRLTRRILPVLAALLIMAVIYAAWSAAPAATSPRAPAVPEEWTTLARATITEGPKPGQLTLELPPVDVPAGAGHNASQPPPSTAEFPVNGAIYAFHAELVDENGRQVPRDLIHHINVMDPNERELFLPIGRRILASGRETGEIRFPWLLFGSRFRAGERVLANAMLHNPTSVSYRGVRVRMIVDYIAERRPWPLFSVLPWQLDVGFPVGDKSFDLPPGQSERSYEGSPAVEGKLAVIGGHMHEFGRSIELWDVTTGELLWHGEPAPAQLAGEPKAVPLGKFYGLGGVGLKITPAHRYRVRVLYDNPTGRTISAGGMGVVGGLFIPSRGAVWPNTDPADSLYQKDVRHFLGQAHGGTPGTGGRGAAPAMGNMHSHTGH